MPTPSSSAVPDPSSRWLAHVLLVAAWALPALVLVALWRSTPEQWAMHLGGPAPLQALAVGTQALVVVLALLPALCMSAGLWSARRCFLSFARGEHFNLATVQALRACARAMVAAGVAGLVVPTLIGLLLSGGQRLSVDLGSGPVSLLIFGAVVWKVASAFVRGMALAEENAQFV